MENQPREIRLDTFSLKIIVSAKEGEMEALGKVKNTMRGDVPFFARPSSGHLSPHIW